MGRRCKRCGSEEQVKNGLMRGQQRYLCKGCGLNRAGFLGGILAWITRLGQAPPSERSSALRLRPGARCRWARAAGGG